jgi:Domain of unknown function (DUF1902)
MKRAAGLRSSAVWIVLSAAGLHSAAPVLYASRHRRSSAPYQDDRRAQRDHAMKPVIFTISAAWDDEASVWSGHCDDIPAAADAPTLDELLSKISAMALDLLPDNHPGVDPASLYLQITALREAEPAVA